MRILFFSNAYPQPSDPGRAVFNFELVRHLAQSHELRAVVPVPWTEALGARLSRRDRHRTIPPGPIVFYPLFVFPPSVFTAARAKWMDLSTRRAVSKALSDWRPDAVLAYWADPDGTVGMSIARRVGTRGVIMVGGTDVLLLTLEPQRRAVIVAALRHADAVITVSEHLRQRVIELGLAPQMVHVIRRPVDPAQFYPGDRLAARRRLGIDTTSPAIVWAGRLVPVKSLDTLLGAFCELVGSHPKARLYLVGSGPLRASLEARAHSLNIAEAVRFVGAVPHAALGEWLRAANIVALSSESEGMPNVLLEAAACDVPFVATDVGGIRELADPAIDRLVPPRDPHAFAAAMADLLDNGQGARPRRPQPPSPAESVAALGAVLSGGPPPKLAQRPVLRPSPLRQLVRRWLASAVPRNYYAVSGSPSEPCVYLTFDDGPDPAVTPRILDALAEARAVATFFLIGDRAERFPALVQRIAAEGHEVGHHSYRHLDPKRVSSREFSEELRESSRAFAAAGFAESRLVRPPHGKLTPGKLLRLWINGYGVVLWNRDPKDYSVSSGDELSRWFDDNPVSAGDIILLHDTRPCTADALPSVIESIRRTGLAFATVSGALGRAPGRSRPASI